MTNLLQRLITKFKNEPTPVTTIVPRTLTEEFKPVGRAISLKLKMADAPNHKFQVVGADLDRGTITYGVNNNLWIDPAAGTITMKVDGLAYHYVEAGAKKVLK